MNVLSQILRDNRFTPESVPELEAKLFFQGNRRRPYLVRFTVLLFLSTIIAAYGALAAGTAAAFAYSRADVADSLPGVAIAIALVPPLSVVGITLSQGEWNAASGAMLLFLTNLLSILLAGGIVFLILDLGGASLEKRELSRARARRIYAFITLGVLLVTVPLAVATFTVAKNSSTQMRIRDITFDWLDRNDIALELQDVDAFNRDVKIVVNGPEEPEQMAELREELESAFPQMDEATMRINIARVVSIPEVQTE